MSGHVFVVRGDIRRLVCDAWVLPVNRQGTITAGWFTDLADGTTPAWFEAYRAGLRAERGWPVNDPRWLDPLRGPGGGVPVLAPTAVAADHVEWAHVTRVLRSVADGMARAPREGPAARRSRPLLAVPAIGTGEGGASLLKGEAVAQLLATAREVADQGVDVAIVTHGPAMTAALRSRRREDLGHWWPDTDPVLVAAARDLAARVRRGEVVLFTGAGTSVPAGLPDWNGLLDRLAGDGLFADEELARLSSLDKAAIVERRLGGRAELIAKVVPAVAAQHYAVGHALLANLPVRENATLNYDELLETAAVDAGRRLAVLPYQRPGSDDDGWLLKLHGCVQPGRQEDIVLTRADYASLSGHRAALTGLLQAMLVTRHLLFVGFGLSDDHFHQVVNDVRRALQQERQRMGTALLLRSTRATETVWSDDLDFVCVGAGAATGGERARQLEVFLDLLANESDQGWQHVLDDTFAQGLDGALLTLRDRLSELIELRPVLEGGGAWPSVETMLRNFGYEPEPSGTG